MQPILEERAVITKGDLKEVDNLRMGKNRMLNADVGQVSLRPCTSNGRQSPCWREILYFSDYKTHFPPPANLGGKWVSVL